MKRRQESESALISYFFISASRERSEVPLQKQERREKCQSVTFDEEQLDPHGVGLFPLNCSHNKK